MCDVIVWHPQVGSGEDATGERRGQFDAGVLDFSFTENKAWHRKES